MYGARMAGLPAPGTARLAAIAIASAVVSLVLAAVGGLLAAGMFDAGRDAAALLRDSSLALDGPAAIAQDVRTSFGVVAVESMTKSRGPTAKALAGMTHGVQNLVPPDHLQVDATVTLTNLQEKVVRYSPRQFGLYATRGGRPSRAARSFRIVRASVEPGTLQPNASIDATLTFVVPRDGSKLWMGFNDGARAPPVVFDLGRIDRTPRGALNRYHAHQR
jgi:hypothetical protein